MTIGEYLKQRRLTHSMSLEYVGNIVGVDRSTVQRWEKGDIKKIDRKHIESLCRILEIDPAIFFHLNDLIFPEERKLIEAYRVADPGTQSSVRKLLDVPEVKKDMSSKAE